MTGLPDHVARARHHRTQRPTSHWSPDLTDTTPHPGVPSACETCRPECIVSASCEPGDHTYSWPCVHAPGTGEAS